MFGYREIKKIVAQKMVKKILNGFWYFEKHLLSNFEQQSNSPVDGRRK